MSGRTNEAKVDFGLYIMYPPGSSPVASENPAQSEAFNIDIVAVHGLRGHYRSTWTDEATQICWLEHPQFLPSHVPNARVMSYYYDAKILSKSVADIKDVARGLIAQLRAKRVSAEEKTRPIIFIAHSLGGIVVKKVIAVTHMQDSELHDMIKAAIFFSVPHQGSSTANLGTVAANAARVTSLGFIGNARFIRDLKPQSRELEDLSEAFDYRSRELLLRTFYETERTGNSVIVTRESAYMRSGDYPTPISGDHITVCKFSTPGARYGPVKLAVNELVANATLTTVNAPGPIETTISSPGPAQMENPEPISIREVETLGDLAFELSSQGESMQAVSLMRQAFQGFKCILGEEHARTLRAQCALGGALADAGSADEGVLLLRQALRRFEETLGVKHYETLLTVQSLSHALWRQGRQQDSEAASRRALEGLTEILGEEDPCVLRAQHDLGVALASQNKFQEAAVVYRQLIPRREKVLGMEHRDTLCTCDCLASVLNAEGDYQGAEEQARRAYEGSQRMFGQDHHVTMAWSINLVHALVAQRKYEEAEALLMHLLEIRKRMLGETHPDTMSTLNQLAQVATSQGKYGDAALWRQHLNRVTRFRT